MKFCIFFLVFVGWVLFLSSGRGQELGSEYYPLQVGNQWHYRVGEDQKVVVRVVGREEFEIKKDTKKEKIKGVTLESTGDGRTLKEKLAVLADGVYRFSSAGREITPPLRFLKLPPRKGETWTVDSLAGETVVKGTFRGDEAEVAVPAGRFQAVTAETQDFKVGDQKMILKYWFVKGVGIVKQQIEVGEHKRVLELEKFEKGK